MITQLNRFILFLLVFQAFPAFSTNVDKHTAKAQKALERAQYTSAVKHADKALTVNKHNVKALVIKAEGLYEISTESKHSKKYPRAGRDAVKSMEKAIQIAGLNEIRLNHEALLNKLAAYNNQEAESSFKLDRFPKAIPLYKTSISFNPFDTLAHFNLGYSYWSEGNRKEAVQLFKKVVDWNFSAFSDSVMESTYQFKAFRLLSRHYLEENEFDSATMYIELGNAMFPNDPVLTKYRLELYRFEVKNMPPSVNYLDIAKTVLSQFPTDSFFQIKENALYIYLFDNYLKNGLKKEADSMLFYFVSDKIERSKKHNTAEIKKLDLFVGSTPLEVFDLFMSYCTNNGLVQLYSWMAPKWVSENLNKDNPGALDYIKLADRELVAGRSAFASLLMYSYYNQNKGAKSIPGEFISKMNSWVNPSLNLHALDYSYQLLQDLRLTPYKKAVEATYKHSVFTLIDSLAHNNFFFRSYSMLEKAIIEFPSEKARLNTFKRKELAILDFKLNYFGTRIALPGKAEDGVTVFKSNMYEDNCKMGHVEDEILSNVINRVNYFRRNAGIRHQNYLDRDLNRYCQWAALMFEANKNMTHKPTDGMRCMTPAGDEAAQHSLLIQSPNPATAISTIMGDKHQTQGNKRWLLYPFSGYMGFGAGPKNKVLWVIDDYMIKDSVLYYKTPVAWPNQGYIPKLFAFEKWTFSLNRDLSNAKIEVKDKLGKSIPVKVEDYKLGYGNPTLVFVPEISINEGDGEQEFTVTVTLENGQKFTYKSIFIDTPKF